MTKSAGYLLTNMTVTCFRLPVSFAEGLRKKML